MKSPDKYNQRSNKDAEIPNLESQPLANSVADVAGGLGNYFENIERWLLKLSLESRGIQRVEVHERHEVTWMSYLQAFQLWLSINLAAINTTIGMLGPGVFELSFKDASLCAVFGSLIGSIAVAYIAPFGPLSGLRSMVYGNLKSN